MSIKGVIEKITGTKKLKKEEGETKKHHHSKDKKRRHHSQSTVTSGEAKKEGHHHHHHKHHSHKHKPIAETQTAPTTIAASAEVQAISTPVVEATKDDAPVKDAGTRFTIVELLHEQNPKKAEHAHQLLEKRYSAELIFSEEGKDVHGLRGRLVPPHSMTVTSQGIHYLTTDEAVAKMDEQESVGKLPKTRAAEVEQESVGKLPKTRAAVVEQESIGKRPKI